MLFRCEGDPGTRGLRIRLKTSESQRQQSSLESSFLRARDCSGVGSQGALAGVWAGGWSFWPLGLVEVRRGDVAVAHGGHGGQGEVERVDVPRLLAVTGVGLFLVFRAGWLQDQRSCPCFQRQQIPSSTRNR